MIVFAHNLNRKFTTNFNLFHDKGNGNLIENEKVRRKNVQILRENGVRIFVLDCN